jgi:hypothetical protein
LSFPAAISRRIEYGSQANAGGQPVRSLQSVA